MMSRIPTPFETAEEQAYPSVRQLSVFVENRVGQLQTLLRRVAETQARILALSVVHSVDCAIVRLMVDRPDETVSHLQNSHFAVSQSELIAVELPEGPRALLDICSALLSAEINIYYAYPLLVRPHGRAALAIKVDNTEQGIEVLAHRKMTCLGEADLGPTP
jgi:hypothetical protein